MGITWIVPYKVGVDRTADENTVFFRADAVGVSAPVQSIRNYAAQQLSAAGYRLECVKPGFTFGYRLFGDEADLSYTVYWKEW